jgi:hypothetical protein
MTPVQKYVRALFALAEAHYELAEEAEAIMPGDEKPDWGMIAVAVRDAVRGRLQRALEETLKQKGLSGGQVWMAVDACSQVVLRRFDPRTPVEKMDLGMTYLLEGYGELCDQGDEATTAEELMSLAHQTVQVNAIDPGFVTEALENIVSVVRSLEDQHRESSDQHRESSDQHRESSEEDHGPSERRGRYGY